MIGQPDTSTTDATLADGPLVARAAAGDAGAFRTLVERHERRIVALLHRLCGCPELALDLAQETFLSAHRHLGSFRHEGVVFDREPPEHLADRRRRAAGVVGLGDPLVRDVTPPAAGHEDLRAELAGGVDGGDGERPARRSRRAARPGGGEEPGRAGADHEDVGGFRQGLLL